MFLSSSDICCNALEGRNKVSCTVTGTGIDVESDFFTYTVSVSVKSAGA